MAQFCGKWKLAKTENFDEYMKALGVNFVLRKMAATASPVTEITYEDGVFTVTTTTTFKTNIFKFKMGEQFEEQTGDGRNCESSVTQDGNKWIHVQKDTKEAGLETTITREFTDDAMKMELILGEIVCKRDYSKL
ncbi:PREDICTED: fatty acid-binding protein, brain-like [Priapulus caudatus]|uniref:Fatty acid-binding protein, brain-like n=1 Tax=Priapulus caudatus TaxID=37621 RepID=A0ABM1DUG6_PRICU|nr:PREDICTED: fatty acid-binding protein, brain-like [Priapulus caudatus]